MADINVGDTLESKSLSVTQELINEYADICGDYNTLHVDVEGMKDHPIFGGTIAHGTINVEPVLQAVCAIQGKTWPTEGTTIDLQFRAPVKPGMTISSNLVVQEKKGNTLACEMQIKDQDGKPCVRGTAEIPV
jgi:oxepin-CoA hydrolase/3-oxo-5,6-dehydrosuberyl-CoA semialdehyde dehydrogenase